MTEAQLHAVERSLILLRPQHVHHGDCIGADKEFHDICRRLEFAPIIHIHPPSNPKKRAFCEGDVTYAEAPYRKRNGNIVKMSDVLLAGPKEEHEIMVGSGTWQTIRLGVKACIKVYIVIPSGVVL